MFVYSPTKRSRPPARRDDLRSHNTALLLRALWEAPDGAARVDLARDSGLSRATVSAITGELIDNGLVHEGLQRESTGGRPAQLLQFNEQRFHLVGIELGASHISGVRTDLRGKLLCTLRTEHDVQGDPEGALCRLGRLLDELVEGATAPVPGIGIAVPSPILAEHPGRLSPDILPRWRGIDLKAWVETHTGLPATLENDANLGALAEHWWGVGRGLTDFAYVKVATGVGSGIIINGDIYRGAGGIAGEIGHTAIDPHGPLCRCGLYGCLEALVGTHSLLTRARGIPSLAQAVPSWADGPTLPGLIDAARAGNPDARELIGHAGQWLGIALANLLNLINPACIILGGRLTLAGDLLLAPLRASMRQRALWTSVADTRVLVSDIAAEPVALGAATLLLQAALSDPSTVLMGDGTSADFPIWRAPA